MGHGLQIDGVETLQLFRVELFFCRFEGGLELVVLFCEFEDLFGEFGYFEPQCRLVFDLDGLFLAQFDEVALIALLEIAEYLQEVVSLMQ
jgi:hypothetical protein